MSILRRIVVVSRKPRIQELAQEVAHEVFVADDLDEASEIVSTVTPDVTLFDECLAPHQIQAYLDAAAGDVHSSHEAIVLTSQERAFGDNEYQRAGITHCLRGEENHPRLRDIVLRIQEGDKGDNGRTDKEYFLDATAAAAGMVGRSRATAGALHMIKLVAHSQCNPVLIVGETGTGKEVAARAVHALRCPDGPFVAINCAALTANLLESELFGHVKGAFTGADRDKTGLLELAGTGTVFLDEISEMPVQLQAKLLRVLQEKTFRKVGGVRNLPCEATIIASSNRKLSEEVREKRFRQDLYYRLNICPIVLAPLHAPQRRDDIELLADYFLKTSCICAAKQNRITAITAMAVEAMRRHTWPGNVRELRNVVERAILLETKDKIGMDSVIFDPTDAAGGQAGVSAGRMSDFSLQKAERELIARALHETGWQKTQAASLLGITRATLYAKVKQYGIRQDKPARAVASDAPAEPEPVSTH